MDIPFASNVNFFVRQKAHSEAGIRPPTERDTRPTFAADNVAIVRFCEFLIIVHDYKHFFEILVVQITAVERLFKKDEILFTFSLFLRIQPSKILHRLGKVL